MTQKAKPPIPPGVEVLTCKLSADEQAKVDHEIWLDQQRRYDEWLATLPIPKRDQDLVRELDYLRRILLIGSGTRAIPPTSKLFPESYRPGNFQLDEGALNG